MRSEAAGFSLIAALAAFVTLTAVTPQSARGQSRSAEPAVRPRSFSGFTPGRCVIAGVIMEQSLRRGVPDTVAYEPAEDTLARSTADSLGLCVKSATVAAPREWEALDLARLQLLAGHDPQARATTTARLAATRQQPVQDRAWELQLIVKDRLEAKPARKEAAYEALRTLDALGAAGAAEQVLAHGAMLSAEAAAQNDSAVRTQVAALTEAWKQLPAGSRVWYAGQLVNAIRIRADIELFADRAADARAAITAGLALLPAEARRERATLERAAKMYAVVGKPASPAQARFWFDWPQAAAGASQSASPSGERAPRPTRGKVAMLLALGRPCTNSCGQLLAAAHRFRERFGGDDTLELTFTTNTYGFYLDTAPATPEAEARHDSSYFVNERRVPGVLGVVETRYTWLSDGRRLDAPTANEVNYAEARVVIIDKRGTVRYVSSVWNRKKEARYARVVERLLAEG